jgi:hypothetical protein
MSVGVDVDVDVALIAYRPAVGKSGLFHRGGPRRHDGDRESRRKGSLPISLIALSSVRVWKRPLVVRMKLDVHAAPPLHVLLQLPCEFLPFKEPRGL